MFLITFVGIQQSMFKLGIKSNVFDAMVKPINLNLFTRLWHIPLIIKVFSYFFLAYFKLFRDCHGRSPWEYGRCALFQFFGIQKI